MREKLLCVGGLADGTWQHAGKNNEVIIPIFPKLGSFDSLSCLVKDINTTDSFYKTQRYVRQTIVFSPDSSLMILSPIGQSNEETFIKLIAGYHPSFMHKDRP